jgi:WD40 repeat protein/type II secretory pathway predicted ATPase ExeA
MAIDILHLSDPQFGPKHRFGDPSTLAATILRDLGALQVKPDLIVVTGDLAEFGRPTEFVQCGHFLDELRGELPRERVLFVPGNHDVSWSRYKAYRDECADYGRPPVPPFWPKWHYYKAFLDSWLGVDRSHFLPDEPWSWWELPDLDLAVAGFNSTLPETDQDHSWALGQPQVDWFRQRLERTQQRFRLGLVHHDLFHGSEAETVERKRLRHLPLQLILHGHTHIQTSGEIVDVRVLGAGSVGVVANERAEDVNNQFQVLRLGDRCERQLRRYYGPDGQFIDDTAVLAEPDRDFALPSYNHRQTDAHAWAGECLVDRVAAALRLQQPGAEVLVLDDAAVQVRLGAHRQLVGVGEEASPAALTAYRSRLSAWQAEDPSLAGTFVSRVGGTSANGIRVQSLSQVQGLIDFDLLRAWQSAAIEADARYPDPLYVDQAVCFGAFRDRGTADSALEAALDLLDEEGEQPRLLVALAPFGTGKTFLVRQLLRRLSARWDVGRRVPIWIELRHLEKAHSFEALLAAHLSRAGQRTIDHNQLAYMRREGRLVLLFDGFDELVLRVSYDRALEHLNTIIDAAEGRARVLLTCRTEHFLRTADVESAMLRRLTAAEGARVMHLQPFTADQARQFLQRRLGDAGAARFERLGRIPDLMELARTPRMLEMLAGLDEADLDNAERRGSRVTAAGLYQVVVERWLRREQQRREVPGASATVGWVATRQAVTNLAVLAWTRGTEELGLDDLRAVVRDLGSAGHSEEELIHTLGSGTLLVRDEAERFRFAHRSILEFLVAEQCAQRLLAGEEPHLLDHGEATVPLVRFVGDLAGDAVDDWARRAAQAGGPERRQAYALAFAAARGLRFGLDLRGQDLRGREELRDLDLRGADLRGADLSGLDWSGVDLSGAKLDGAVLVDTRLAGARMEGVSGVPAEVAGCSLLGVAEAPAWARAPEVQAELHSQRAIHCLAWSPDGRWLAVGGTNELRIFDRKGPRRSIAVPGSVRAVAWSPDGQQVCTGGDDGVLRVWDLVDGGLVRELGERGDAVRALAWSPDGGTILASIDAIGLTHWVFESGRKLTRTLLADVVASCIRYSPDGAAIAVGSADGTVVVIDSKTLLVTATPGRLDPEITAVVWSLDSTSVCVAAATGAICLWDALGGNLRWENRLPKGGVALQWLADGSAIVAATAWRLLRLSVDDGRLSMVEPGTPPIVAGETRRKSTVKLAIAPNGMMVAIGLSSGSIALQEHVEPVVSAPPAIALGWTKSAIEFSAWEQGSLHVGMRKGGGSFSIWNFSGTSAALVAESSHNRESFLSTKLEVYSSPSRSLVLLGLSSGEYQLTNLQSGVEAEPVFSLNPQLNLRLNLDFTPEYADGRLSPDGTKVVCLEPLTGELDVVALSTAGGSTRVGGHEATFFAATWSPDGAFLCTRDWHGQIHFWWATSVALAGEVSTCAVGSTTSLLVYSVDGSRLAAADFTGRLHVYRIQKTSTPARSPIAACEHVSVQPLPPSRSTTLAWSPTSTILASGGDDGHVHLWDPSTGDLLRTFAAHSGPVRTISFAPDGQRMCSGGDDGFLRLWDVGTGAPLGWMAVGPDGAVCVAPDGSYRIHGDVRGWFFLSHGLHRYEADEVERLLPHLRVPDGEPFPWGRTAAPPPQV